MNRRSELPRVDRFGQREIEMDAARGARADDEIATEAEAFQYLQDGLEAAVIGMEDTVDIDVEHQIVCELAEALAEEDAASVV